MGTFTRDGIFCASLTTRSPWDILISFESIPSFLAVGILFIFAVIP